MDSKRRLIGKGFQAFSMNSSEKSWRFAIQEDKANHLTINGYWRTDIGAQPIGSLQPLPTPIRKCVMYDHSLPGRKHLLQIACFRQWKFNSHDLNVETALVVPI